MNLLWVCVQVSDTDMDLTIKGKSLEESTGESDEGDEEKGSEEEGLKPWAKNGRKQPPCLQVRRKGPARNKVPKVSK